MDENLPAEWDQFFSNGGEMPDSLKALQTPVEVGDPPAPVEAVVPPAEPVVAPVTQGFVQQNVDPRVQQTLDALQKQVADLTAALNKPAPEVVPDPNTDPLGHLMYQQKQIQARIDAMTQQNTQSNEQITQQNQMNAFLGAVNQHVAAFKATTPDYDAAYQHLVNTRVADYTDRGYAAEEARKLVQNEEMDIAARALQGGKNPAEVAYGMAKRYGYKPTAAPVTPESKLDTIRKGQALDAGLQKEGTPEKITLASLKEASDAQLDKMVQDDWEGLFGKRKGIFG